MQGAVLAMDPNFKVSSGLLTRISAVLWLTFVAALLFGQENAPEKGAKKNDSEAVTVTVDKSFNNREIKVRLGDVIRVRLEELGGAGYQWKIQDLDGEHFEVLSVRTESKPSELEGAPVVKTWLIRSKNEGKSELRLVHSRSWEDAKKPSDTFILKVRIIR